MMSLPRPATMWSLPPRPRILSSPSLPASLSGLSVPKSRPPLLGQPGRSFVVKTPPPAPFGLLMVLVPPHRASSSDAGAWGECPCSFLLEVSELVVPAQPTTRRRTAHPIRKANTAMLRPRRTTTPSPPLHASPATSTSKHATHRGPARFSLALILRSAWKGYSRKFACRSLDKST